MEHVPTDPILLFEAFTATKLRHLRSVMLPRRCAGVARGAEKSDFRLPEWAVLPLVFVHTEQDLIEDQIRSPVRA